MENNIFDEAQNLISPALIEYFYPGGKWKKDEYWICSPLRDDTTPNSFSISDKGLFKDFATNDKGNFFDLLSRSKNITKKEAAELITGKPKIEIKPLSKKSYLYFEKDGKLAFTIHRTDFNNNTKTFSFQNKNNGYKEPPEYKSEGARPLYKLPEIIKNFNSPILLVEGEKCAEVNIPDIISTTFSGGSKRFHLTDFSPLYGRNIILWPDNDETGIAAITEIGDLLIQNKSIVKYIKTPDGKSKGWDIANADKNEIEKLITNAVSFPFKNENTEIFPLTPFSAAYDPRPAREWLVKDMLIDNGLYCFNGDSGAGKTFALIDLTVCVAMGILWLGMETRQCPAIILDEESGPNRLLDRLEQAGRYHNAPAETPIYFMGGGFDINKVKHVDILKKRVKETGSKFLVIDSFVRICAGMKENETSDMSPIMNTLNMLKRELNISILFLHHVTKGGASRGSTDIKAAVDFMANLKNNGVLTLSTKNPENGKTRDTDEIEFRIKVDFKPGNYKFELCEQISDIEENDKLKKVLKHLLKHPDLKDIYSIRINTQITEKTLIRVLRSLEKDKFIKKQDNFKNGQKALYTICEEKKDQITTILEEGYE